MVAMSNKLTIILTLGILMSITALGQGCSVQILNDTTRYGGFPHDLCDSLFFVDRLQGEGKLPMFVNESMPYPIPKKKDSYHIKISVPEGENVAVGKYNVFVKLVVTTDSLPRCVTVIKSDNLALNKLAIKVVDNMKFMPAKRNNENIPYFCFIKLLLEKN